jgi:naphthoate synthase
MSDRDEEASARRLRVLEGHLARTSHPKTPISRANTVSGGSYATATGQPSSYARVHGEVSREPAVWRCIGSVHKELLEEVKYEKSDEGIAKVR